MKTIKSSAWITASVAALMFTLTLPAMADDGASAAKADENYTGTITSIDAQESTLSVKGFLSGRKFNLGGDCHYVLLDKPVADISDLRSGEKVKVSYQDANGVLVADRVEQEPVLYEGQVKAIDPAARTLTVHSTHWLDKTFQIGSNCVVKLHYGVSGSLDNIQPGNFVTVTYETPDDRATARQIAQTSASFTGTLTAIDLSARTIKARTLFNTKKFNLADHCAIVIDGKMDGKLADLKPDEKLVFSYNEVNGVNIANRIAPADAAGNSAVVEK